MTRRNTVAALAGLISFALGGAAWAGGFSGVYDFSGTQYIDDFTDIRRGTQINAGLDLGGTEHSALNFTGSTGSAGDTWLTKFTPGGSPSVFDASCFMTARASVLIHPFSNKKGAGVVALLNQGLGDKGLALIVSDAGNTDTLQLATIDPATGKLKTLASVPLKNAIKENAWYFVLVNVVTDGDDLFVGGQLYSHVDPGNPDSDLGGVVSLNFTGTLSGTGLKSTGHVGIVASAVSAVVSSSVTGWAAQDDLAETESCSDPT